MAQVPQFPYWLRDTYLWGPARTKLKVLFSLFCVNLIIRAVEEPGREKDKFPPWAFRERGKGLVLCHFSRM